MEQPAHDHPSAGLRVGDADRDAAIAALSDHFGAGRITAAELDDRIGAALRARTSRDISALFADLPAAPPQPRPELPDRRPRAVFIGAAVLLAVLVAGSALVSGRPACWAPWWVIPIAFFWFRRIGWRRRYARWGRER